MLMRKRNLIEYVPNKALIDSVILSRRTIFKYSPLFDSEFFLDSSSFTIVSFVTNAKSPKALPSSILSRSRSLTSLDTAVQAKQQSAK